jgi:hypothetical protein
MVALSYAVVAGFLVLCSRLAVEQGLAAPSEDTTPMAETQPAE